MSRAISDGSAVLYLLAHSGVTLHLKGANGDAINAVLVAADHNMRLLLAWFAALLRALISVWLRLADLTITADHPKTNAASDPFVATPHFSQYENRVFRDDGGDDGYACMQSVPFLHVKRVASKTDFEKAR